MTHLTVPRPIEELIAKLDQSVAPLDEHQVRQALTSARQALVHPTEAENLGTWAEVLAFALVGTRHHSSPWGTFFGPIASGRNENGEPFYSPDIAGADAKVVAHWIHRAKSLAHPVLKARYADLSWDMSRAIAKAKPDPDMARTAIDAYLSSLTRGLRSDIHDEFEAALRALDLAEMLRDRARTHAARGALLQLHRRAVEKGKGLWWTAFDRLVHDKHAGVTAEEREQLVADLEAMAARFSNTSNPTLFDPHAAQSATDRLIAYYNKLKRHDDAARLSELIARAFEHAATLADPMLASAFLQTAVSAFRNARLHDESKRVRALMEEKIVASQAQMQTFTFERTITKHDMERFLSAVVVDDVGSTFVRLASEFLQSRDQLEMEVKELLEKAPLMAMMTQTVMAERHVAAQIGSVDDDPFGRLIQQAAQSISFSDIWLTAALDRAVEKHSLTPHHFVGWAARTRLFEDLTFLMEGVTAWFTGDFVKAVHVLVPQFEVALRAIAGKLGRPTTKAHPRIAGASVAVNMGDILYSADVTDALGPDITLHLLTLYADPRGFNLRNDMAHGLLSADGVGDIVVNRLIHTLLVLGIWHELAKARKAQRGRET